MKFIAVIPARYASSRFPGKPLADIKGKPMVQHVYEKCSDVFEHVFVATDDERISDTVKAFNGKVVLTSPDHPSGTDRIAEAAQILSADFNFDIIVNVQGDEPFIDPAQLKQIQTCFNDPQTDIATLITPIKETEILFDTNKVKAVVDTSGFALYFSRQPVPFKRELPEIEWINHHTYFLHVGLYAYKADVLQKITKIKQTPLEKAEKLEQLRWLESGLKIRTVVTAHSNFGIDTPNDLEKAKKLFK